MPETAASSVWHISSAVVTALPKWRDEVVAGIGAMPDTEVRHVKDSKIVIILEGASTGEIGARLTAIALMNGVLSANLVFEQIDAEGPPGVQP